MSCDIHNRNNTEYPLQTIRKYILTDSAFKINRKRIYVSHSASSILNNCTNTNIVNWKAKVMKTKKKPTPMTHSWLHTFYIFSHHFTYCTTLGHLRQGYNRAARNSEYLPSRDYNHIVATVNFTPIWFSHGLWPSQIFVNQECPLKENESDAIWKLILKG